MWQHYILFREVDEVEMTSEDGSVKDKALLGPIRILRSASSASFSSTMCPKSVNELHEIARPKMGMWWTKLAATLFRCGVTVRGLADQANTKL